MPAYSRDSGAWDATVMRHRDGGAWSGDDALGFVRDGGAWVQFQAPTGDEDLLKPTNLAADAGDIDATLSWSNPTPLSEAATPTHIQYRFADITPVWTELPYPATSVGVGFLSPSTEYHFQVRYILREDGDISLTGEIAELFFSTIALDGPGTPAKDPGGTGPDTTVPWGSTNGTPGAVGGSDCWWEYIVQTATTPASGAMTWGDTAVTGDFAGDAGSLDIDLVFEGLTCGGLARYKYREVCDSVPGDYEYGEPFIMVCDWDAACGGAANRDLSAAAPFSDSIFTMPKVCAEPTDALNIEDHIVTTVYGKLSGFFGTSLDTTKDTDIVVGGTITGYEPIVAGAVGALALLVDTDDFSCMGQVMLAEVPEGAADIGAFPIFRYGRNVALSAVRATSSTWYGRVSWQDQLGNGQTLTGTTALSLDEWHQLGASFDNTGEEVILYVDGAEEATTTSDLALEDAAMGQDVEVYGNSFIRVMMNGAWDRVLSPNEFSAGYSLDAYPTISWVNESVDDTTVPSMQVEAGDFLLVFSMGAAGYSTTPTGLTTRHADDDGVIPLVEDYDEAVNYCQNVGTDYVCGRIRGYMARGDGTFRGNGALTNDGGHIVVNLGKTWNHVDGIGSFRTSRDNGNHTGGSDTTDTLIADPGGDTTIYFQCHQRATEQVDGWVVGATDLIGSQQITDTGAWRGETISFGAMHGDWNTDAGAITKKPYSFYVAFNIEKTLSALTGTPEVYDDGTNYNYYFQDSGVLVATGIGSPPATADMFLVGGGGGGGWPGIGGGGGGGTALTSTGDTLTLPATITVGEGGAGGNPSGSTYPLDGGDTTALGQTAGGGTSAGSDYRDNADALGLGLRGGGSNDDYNGGNDNGSAFGGGGAGAGAVGEDSETDGANQPGDGGAGVSNTWRDGTSIGYGGGGGAGGTLGGTAGTATDGGGAGGDPPSNGTNGLGGGGGSRHKNFGGSMTGANGGNGAAIIQVVK